MDDYRKLGCKIHMAPWMKKITRRRGAAYVLSYLFSYLPGVLEMARVIRREKIDIVHTNTIHNPYGFLAAKIAGAKHVWHIREIVVQSKWVRAIEVTLVKLFSDKFIVMDNAIGEAFLSPNHGFPKNIVKLYDGVNLDQFSPKTSGQRIRKELGISQEAALVGIVCRLDPWKGLDVFLSAAKKVNEKDPKVCFLICGGEIEGHEGYEASLKEKAKSLGLEAVIYFTGWRYFGKDIPEVYAALNVSVQCPRYPEPYGLANVEAMASGVPHVSINQGGPLELCGDGTTGFLVPVDNPAEIARAILKLTQNPNLAESMGKAGRQRAERFFDYQKCTRELEKIYFEAMKSL